MNIEKTKKKKEDKKLFENELVEQPTQQKVETDKIETILSVKSKQFEFDSGIMMGAINYRVESKFSLWYHNQSTNNIEDFVTSVKQFIESTGNILTDNDEVKLRTDWYKVNEI